MCKGPVSLYAPSQESKSKQVSHQVLPSLPEDQSSFISSEPGTRRDKP